MSQTKALTFSEPVLTRILWSIHLRDHLVEFLDLVLAQLPVVLRVGHVQLVLRLRLGWLERARQDGQFHVFELLQNDWNLANRNGTKLALHTKIEGRNLM